MERVLGVSIVNYRTAELVVKCLSCLHEEKQKRGTLHVVVVDNNSGDGSYGKLLNFVTDQGWGDWIEVVAAPSNGGYSSGNNIALSRLLRLGCHYLWLLNPDTEPRPGAADALITQLELNAEVGITGSRLEDHDGTPQISAFNFPQPLGEFVNTCKLGILHRAFPKLVIPRPVSDLPETVDWVAGASMMLRADVVQKIGLMDTGYFLYFEEVDYCRKAQAAGFKVLYVPESRVVHMVGAATGISDTRKAAPRRPVYWFESRRRFFQKNYGYLRAAIADALWILAYSSYRLRAAGQQRSLLEPPRFLYDFIRNSSLVKGRCSNDT